MFDQYTMVYIYKIKTTSSYQDTSSCSDFIIPKPINRTPDRNSLRDASPIDFENSDTSSSISKDVKQCNTIVHRPNSRCLTYNIESQYTSPLPNPYDSNVTSPINNPITGIKYPIYYIVKKI